jgi:hypothetical protein
MADEPSWKDRELRFTVVVSQPTGSHYRAQAAWADNDEVIAVCDAPRPGDSLAGAAAALAQVFGRAELASGVERAITQTGAAREGSA